MKQGVSVKVYGQLLGMLLYSLIFCAPGIADSSGKVDENVENTLVLLNWSEYLDPEVLKEFEEKFGIGVTEIYFETEEMRNDMLVSSNGQGFDLLICSDVDVKAYARKGRLAPVSESQVPNLKHVYPKWRNAFPEAQQYAVPFMWGTLGIAYRNDKITRPIDSWMDLYKPQEDLKGRIVMNRDSRELIGMALKALGYSANSTVSEELDMAKELLLSQKPFVKSYSYVNLSEKSSLVSGDAFMAMVYNGDALMLQSHDPSITYVLPKEGGLLWCDFFLVLKSSKKKELAYKFLNFLHEPEIMKRLALYAYYAPTNMTAEKYLPADFLSDPVIYPSSEVLTKSENATVLPPRVSKKYNTIFSLVVQ